MTIVLLGLIGVFCGSSAVAQEFLKTSGKPGNFGGRLVIADRSQPRTLNPLASVDNVSREIIQLITADLVHINRESQRTEPALAASWMASPDRRRYVVRLRRGVRFSDGHPCDADDVLFTFQAHLDPAVRSPQRDLLIVGGKPLMVTRQDSHTVVFEFTQPYGPGERLFDGFAILPRHLLEKDYSEGKLAQIWTLTANPEQIAGLGPFRFKEYEPGQRLIVERNPFYWKEDSAGKRLPYLDSITFEFVGSEDAQALKFQAGETDIISRVGPRNFELLSRLSAKGWQMKDVGPGLEYNFVFFNLNDLSDRTLPLVRRKQAWFLDVNFRRAISSAIDRDAIVRIAYAGRATPISSHVTPGNRLWRNDSIPKPVRSLDAARRLLASGGFVMRNSQLIDGAGQPVEFSIVTSSGNPERAQMATVIQDDLKQLGISIQVVALEFRSLLDRVMNTRDYEACLLGLGSGDVDPGTEMNVWLSEGSSHLWQLRRPDPLPEWQIELDRLMKQQMMAATPGERKPLYDRVQQLIAEYLPIIPLVSPNILVGAKPHLGNFRPAILPSYVLWNAHELFWEAGRTGRR